MNITINATNMNLNRVLRDHIEKKVGTLRKYIGEKAVHASVEISRTTVHHNNGDIYQAEITVRGLGGKDFFARAEKEDIYVAIDTMQADITREIKSYKTKKHDLFKRGALRVKNALKSASEISFRRKRSA